MQIIEDSTAGGRIGAALSGALNELAQHKLDHIQRQYYPALERAEYAKGISPIVGEQAAKFLSHLSPQDRSIALQNLGPLMRLQNTSPQEQMPTSTGIQSVAQGVPAQSPQSPLIPFQQRTQNPEQSLAALSSLIGMQPAQVFGQMQSNPSLSGAGAGGLGLQLPKAPKKAVKPQSVSSAVNAPATAAQSPDTRAELLKEVFTSPKQRIEQEKLKADRFKATKEERKKIVEEGMAARDQLRDLNRIQELEDGGQLDTAGYNEFLNRSGLDVAALRNTDSQEFQKIVNNFTRDAKTYFGGRVSNFEVEQFMKTVPSLSQSPEGRKRVIANLKYLANAKLEYYDALKDVMKENKGVPPYDLLEQVTEKVEGKQKSLSDRFKKDLQRPVPKSQNRLVTALQAGAGSILGAPGTVLGAAGRAISGLGR